MHVVGHRLTSSILSCTHCVRHALRSRDFREHTHAVRALGMSFVYSIVHLVIHVVICSMFSGAHSIRHFVP